MTAPRDHPLRGELHGEIHARPFTALYPPERISYIAMLSGEDGAEADRAWLAQLCSRFGVSAPQAGNHLYHDFGPFRLKWERHTEFCTYTIFLRGRFAAPFDDPVVHCVPADWLEGLPGELLVATHVAVESVESPDHAPERIVRLIGSENVVGSSMSGGAQVWTDFHLHGDGFGRILVHDRSLAPYQAGRLTQRLLEIETYRIMALLALPLAQRAGPEVTRIDRALVGITGELSDLHGIEDERDMLLRLSRLAAETEQLVSNNSYRFSAAFAYHALVVGRIEELREERIDGLQTIGEFMERRLAPAMRTCESVATRQDSLAQRIARASNLLRTRVDVTLEQQNQDLLRSMSRRARLQLRLQTMIEGVSVVAASYYLLGLLVYVMDGIEKMGIPVDPEISAAVAVPVVVGIVWLVIRSVRRRLIGGGVDERDEQDAA